MVDFEPSEEIILAELLSFCIFRVATDENLYLCYLIQNLLAEQHSWAE